MKSVIVTGAASGIGRHFAEMLVSRHYAVTVADKDQEGLAAAFPDKSVSTKPVWRCALDVTQLALWQQCLSGTVDRFGALDYLFNIAGVIKPGYIDETAVTDIDLHMDINAKGLMIGSKLAAETMVAQGHGHIINMSSLAGVAPVPGLSLYSASKFAVRSFSLAIANELRPHNVFVTVVCPDAVATPMLSLQLDYEEAALTFSGNPKPLTVDDVAYALAKAMAKRPLEITLPASRGWLAKFGNTFPRTHSALAGALRRIGNQRRKSMRSNV